jgi:hypothetical protein
MMRLPRCVPGFAFRAAGFVTVTSGRCVVPIMAVSVGLAGRAMITPAVAAVLSWAMLAVPGRGRAMLTRPMLA